HALHISCTLDLHRCRHINQKAAFPLTPSFFQWYMLDEYASGYYIRNTDMRQETKSCREILASRTGPIARIRLCAVGAVTILLLVFPGSITAAVRQNQQKAVERYQHAGALLQEGNFAEAEKEILEVLKDYPDL